MTIERCKICGSEGAFPKLYIKEMQYDLGGVFEYFKCSKCECLQIEEVPGNIAEYYPEDYYAHTANMTGFVKIMYAALKKGEIYHFKQEKSNIIGRLFCFFLPEFLYPINTGKDIWDKRILDVGCGNGRSLRILREIGFKHVLGIEPFVEDDIKDDNNEVLVRKADIFSVNEKFDIIILQHSLEHMEGNCEVLMHINKCLYDSGECIISIPTVSSWAWDKYGSNWFNLDAPRHLFLHSIQSISILADKTGFKVDQIKYNSNHSQITGSELYVKSRYTGGVNKHIYSPVGTLNLFINSIRAKQLNKMQKGDMITVRLRKQM